MATLLYIMKMLTINPEFGLREFQPKALLRST
jgi:hypothetical protein